MLIDISYFDKVENNIPNTTYPDVASLVNSLIAVYEPEYLSTVLGYSINKDFQAGLLVGTVDQKFKDIRDGVEFTGARGQVQKWPGLVGTIKQSPIAYIL